MNILTIWKVTINDKFSQLMIYPSDTNEEVQDNEAILPDKEEVLSEIKSYCLNAADIKVEMIPNHCLITDNPIIIEIRNPFFR